MGDKLILEIKVELDFRDVSALDGPGGKVVLIPFGGTAEGEIFSGAVCKGGVDRQVVNLAGVRHMSARYMLDGRDYTGAPCKIYIENNGWFSENSPMPFATVPTFLTDSKALAPYLHQNKFRGEGHAREGGVLIKFYEVGAD